MREDFASIWGRYEPFGAVAKPSSSLPHLRFLHRFAFTISMVCKAVPRGRSENLVTFLGEMASDAVLALHAALVGDAGAASFYMRSAIENLWRHIYFSTHSVEYRWLRSRPKFYQPLAELRAYCGEVGVLPRALKQPTDALGDQFDQLSRRVHSSAARSTLLKDQLASISLTREDAEALATVVKTLGRDLILLLSVVHHEEIRKKNPLWLSFITSFLDDRRKALRMRALSE